MYFIIIDIYFSYIFIQLNCSYKLYNKYLPKTCLSSKYTLFILVPNIISDMFLVKHYKRTVL